MNTQGRSMQGSGSYSSRGAFLRNLLPAVSMFFMVAFTSGQDAIDYDHKFLARSLRKSGIEGIGQLTELRLPDSIRQAVHGKFFVTDSLDESLVKFIYIGRMNSCHTGGCKISGGETVEGRFEFFDYCIFFDRERKVQNVSVFSYQATHGQEITAKSWLKQFIGYDGEEELKVEKEIDAISGATISVYAITYDIQAKTGILQLLQHQK